METEVIAFDIYPKKVDVEYRNDSFRPNRVSEAFLKAIPKNLDGLVVDDIGSGGGVIAIIEANRGALEVRAVEPADANYKLLVRNIERNVLQDRITAYQGVFFDPIAHLPRADLISADVSGIPEILSRALGWYPEGIPTGGPKGTEITCELLRRAPKFLKTDGKLYFPTANDLLDAEEILQVARDNFKVVENALWSKDELEKWKLDSAKSEGKLWKSPEYIWFHLREEDMQKIDRAYNGAVPKTINIQEIKGRYFWRGQIYVATQPKI
ncbi:MAG: hypothetical protein Q8N99_03410 [Nanoarchaeota archaeon]|nr:hypothetical protein [Nanoarchaeota archaeon]